MNLRHLVRMSRWARHPPPLWRVKLVFAVVALCLLIVGLDHFGLWPEGLRLPGTGGLVPKVRPLP
ncbi:MAG: hypothetical protein H6895_07745 [Defluviimonas sp.]|uniref:hypothetical protein n=1 Tax=Albidovulum sp. TaxID=1872424 RepID=UPI002A274BB5|nr:hypothetical protein [Defluviimonas sp.]